jgi:hypothetical protein
MHGHTYIKFACAKQAKDIHTYKNIKRRLYRTTAAIWFNKTCKIKQLTPAYMSIKINGNNRQDRNTLRMATAHRLNQEIKFLHIKKSRLNEQLYETHLRCTALWPGCWPSIQDIIDNNLQKEMDFYYDGLNKKLDKLQEKQKRTTSQTTHGRRQQTYPRTINLTNIQFTNEEQTILDLGLQYSLQRSQNEPSDF